MWKSLFEILWYPQQIIAGLDRQACLLEKRTEYYKKQKKYFKLNFDITNKKVNVNFRYLSWRKQVPRVAVIWQRLFKYEQQIES